MNCSVSYIFVNVLIKHGVISRIFFVYIGAPITVLGIVTSALTVALFRREKETFVSTRFVLSCIAVTDIAYLTSCLGLGIALSMGNMHFIGYVYGKKYLRNRPELVSINAGDRTIPLLL